MPNSFSSPARSFSIAAASPKPLSMILAPSAASARAVASPMPEVEPVTSAVLPFNMAVLVASGLKMASYAVGKRATEPASIFVAVQYVCSRVRDTTAKPLDLRMKVNRSLAKKAHAHAVFPAPGHDHERCASDAIAHAEAICAARAGPITIYRALDFLREQGLVHRIESRNAFIACVQNHASADPVVFLICEQCGTVGE